MTAYEALTQRYILDASLGELEDWCKELRESLPELKCRKQKSC